MDDALARMWSDLIGRLHGPFSFRFVLQPIMAALYAARDGLADAREGRPPYFWTLFTHPREGYELLCEGWKHVSRVILLGVVMDVLYQVIEFGSIRLVQLIVVVLALAFIPYLVLRGPMNRIGRRWG